MHAAPGPSLRDALEPAFSAEARARGQELFLDGRVEIEGGGDRSLAALVAGRRARLELRGGALLHACSCAATATRCEHLWSAILEASLTGLLRAVERGRPVELAPLVEPADEPAPAPPPRAEWRRQLSELSSALRGRETGGRALPWPKSRQLVFLIDADGTAARGHLVLRLGRRDRRSDGSWGRVLAADVAARELGGLPAKDRDLLLALKGAHSRSSLADALACSGLSNPLELNPAMQRALLPQIVATGRCFLEREGAIADGAPLALEGSPDPWSLGLDLVAADGCIEVRGALRRDGRAIDVAEPSVVTDDFVIHRDRVAPLECFDAFEWISFLRASGPLQGGDPDDEAELGELMGRLLALERLPPLVIDPSLRIRELRGAPKPGLRLEDPPQASLLSPPLVAEVGFDYGGFLVRPDSAAERGWASASRCVVHRDRAIEERLQNRLLDLGVREEWDPQAGRFAFELPQKAMLETARTLLAEGWEVVARGRILREADRIAAQISGGIDWFELGGTVGFGVERAPLPQVLRDLKARRWQIDLRDGSAGILPLDWQRRLELIARVAEHEPDGARLSPAALPLLDALAPAGDAAAAIEVQHDAASRLARERLASFRGLISREAPAGLLATLRPYQLEALGWFAFLREFGFGGCLADDMGLGKTVQVLALLLERKRAAGGAEDAVPSLVVAPRSLLFNWRDEARRFAPDLRVKEYGGEQRGPGSLLGCDVVLTTYGVLWRDVDKLELHRFDYAILDEAQAIKNIGTRCARAALRLRARHRLALSGTPIENHVGELLAQLEFLNPGIQSGPSVFRRAAAELRNPDAAARDLLAAAIRPFVLRRTKEEVAKDLPAKVEETLRVELSPPERAIYDELREGYRNSILARVDAAGMDAARMEILEGLLRLRQAACHVALLDGAGPPRAGRSRRDHPSAKLDALLERLAAIVREGAKAIVFSQFTRLLALVRERLDRAGLVHEYLDGRTRDRRQRVSRFQGDGACGIFLISLKAGGVGLNLTAADYVFLLDPWWNPAVEAQAIDRAHRIGRKSTVFAYRLIAQDTVEERMLELQQRKRALFDAVLGGGKAGDLTRADLERLLD